MELKTKILIASGAFTAIAYIVISSLIKTNEAIWVLTRIFGIISFISLFIAVALGELRLLSKIKGDFVLFKFHTPMSIFSLYIVLLHFISAAFDKFKWGKNLNFADYLGFSFSDKWMVLLSLGTLAFYLMILVGATSSSPSMRKLGFKKWKLVHYLGYVSFIIAYIHSINLGTDLKHSALEPILYPFFLVAFLLVLSLFLARILNSFKLFEDQYEINLATVFLLLLIIGSAISFSINLSNTNKVQAMESQVLQDSQVIDLIQQDNSILSQQNANLTKIMEEIKNG